MDNTITILSGKKLFEQAQSFKTRKATQYALSFSVFKKLKGGEDK